MIAGPPKATPAIAGYLVVDFSWYHYNRHHHRSVVFYPLRMMCELASPVTKRVAPGAYKLPLRNKWIVVIGYADRMERMVSLEE